MLVLIGPSGGGKSSVARELHRLDLIHVHPTWTTRPPRADEAGGSLEHRFVLDDEFDRRSSKGLFIAEGAITGLPYRYGLPAIGRSASGPVDAVMLRAPHVGTFRSLVPDCLVYEIADTGSRTRRRLGERGTAPFEVAIRAADNEVELATGRQVADRIFWNDDSLRALTDRVAAALFDDLGATSAPRPERGAA